MNPNANDLLQLREWESAKFVDNVCMQSITVDEVFGGVRRAVAP